MHRHKDVCQAQEACNLHFTRWSTTKTQIVIGKKMPTEEHAKNLSRNLLSATTNRTRAFKARSEGGRLEENGTIGILVENRQVWDY